VPRRGGQVEYLNIPLISQTGGIRLSLWTSKVHNMPAVRDGSKLGGIPATGGLCTFFEKAPKQLTMASGPAVYLDHELEPAGRETGACPFRARFRKVSIPQ
jgi:hypothetical protein